MKRSTESSMASTARKKSKESTSVIDAPPDTGDPRESDGGEWSTVERRKSGKKKKTQKSSHNDRVGTSDGSQAGVPRFMYSNGDLSKRSHPVGIEDVRDLVLHLTADAPPSNWVRIENAHCVQKVVALLIPGLTPSLLSLQWPDTQAKRNLPVQVPVLSPECPGLLHFIHNTFSHACPTRAPGDKTRMHTILGAFFQAPISSAQKAKKMQERLSVVRASMKDPALYTVSLEQMIENEYPIPSYMADVFQKPPGWVESPQAPAESLLAPEDTKPKLYAIDCEMCLTEDGNELARICVIDYDTELVLYDQLVKPHKPVLDYLTRWSGITPASLSSVTTTLADVQMFLLPLLSRTPTPILLGHSLDSDLKALKLCHPRCIDTALMYHHPRGRPMKPGLAWLTKKWCGREIQANGDGGHDPQEDARACLDLLKLKLENGPEFGEFKTDHESILERMARSGGGRKLGGAESVRTAVVDYGNPAMMHGSKATTSISCKNDGEVLDGLVQTMPSHQFAFARFMGLADVLGWTTPKDTPQLDPPSSPVPVDTLTPHLATLNAHLTALHAALPARTALVIFTGHDDPRRMAHLNARKVRFEREIKGGKSLEDVPRAEWWSAQEGRELEQVVEEAKRGLVFVGVKG